jgi:hypothetical protein
VSPCHQFLSELDVAPCPARFGTFLDRSSEFVIFSGLVPGLLGVEFASLHDLYRASRSCHKVLDELILEVLLSTSKPCINTKLQNRHARMNLLYQAGQYQWIKYKTHVNTKCKLMARLTDFHCQHQASLAALMPPRLSSFSTKGVSTFLHKVSSSLHTKPEGRSLLPVSHIGPKASGKPFTP